MTQQRLNKWNQLAKCGDVTLASNLKIAITLKGLLDNNVVVIEIIVYCEQTKNRNEINSINFEETTRSQ